MATLGANPLDLIKASLARQNEPVETKAPEPDENENVLSGFLRGITLRASAVGEPVSPETFDQRFAKSITPGKEFLANLLYGFSASSTGQKMRSVKERAFDQFVQEKTLQQQQEQIAQQDQAQKIQAANILQRMVEARQQIAQRNELARIEAITDANKRNDEMAKFLVTSGQNADKIAETLRHNQETERNAKLPKDEFFRFGMERARTLMVSQGMDPDDPINQSELLNAATAFGNQYFENRERIKQITRKNFGPAPAERRDRLRYDKIQNGWGEDEIAVYNLDKLRFEHKPGHWVSEDMTPRNFTAGDVAKLETAQNQVSNLRHAAEVALRNPDAVGTFARALDPKYFAATGGQIPTDFRTLRTLLQRSISENILFFSGAATSAKEEVRLREGYPALFETPESFIPAVVAMANMQEAAIIRQRSGIDPNLVDMSEVMDSFAGQLQKHIGELRKNGHSLSSIKIPTGAQFLERAAEKKGLKVIRDAKGRIRGVSQ